MTSIRTLAPLPRHWSAWVFCFCASLSALVIVYDTPAFLNAATSAGLSNFSPPPPHNHRRNAHDDGEQQHGRPTKNSLHGISSCSRQDATNARGVGRGG